VYTVSPGRAASVLSGGLALVPDHSLEDVDAGLVPEPDVVVVPAVAGPAGKELAPVRDWITRRADRGAHILGVCAGSALLAAAGLLDGRRATSHWSNIASLRRKHPQVEWVRGQRYVVDGSITTTGGVTSGIFGALRLVGQLAGTERDRDGVRLCKEPVLVVEQEELQVGELLVLAVPMSVRDGVVVHEFVPGGAELVAASE